MNRITSTSLALCAIALTLACEDPMGEFSQLRSELKLETAGLLMGERYVGTRGSAQVTLRNSGNAAVKAALELQGGGATAFQVEPHAIINAESEARIQIDFIPDRPGSLEAVLVIAHDADSRSPLWMTLNGSGKATPSCQDGNPCTEDWFDLEVEACRHDSRHGSCDDGNACTEGDRCVDTECLGQPVDCWDPTGCTLDTCDPRQGCVFVPQHSQCLDDDPCTADICDPLLGCINPPQAEGTLCGVPSCEEFSICIAGQCLHGPTPDDFPCEDGDVCTTGDSCQAGECVAGDGDPFGLIDAVEIAPRSQDGAQVAEVLALSAGELGTVDVVYHTQAMPPDPCDCPAEECSTDSCGTPECVGGDCGPTECGDCYDPTELCDCPTFAGAEVRVASATNGGVVIQDTLLERAVHARAAMRDADVYVVGISPDDPYQTLRLRRHSGAMVTGTNIAPPAGAVEGAIELAVTEDEVILAQLFVEEMSACGGRPSDPDYFPCTAEPSTVFQASVLRFGRDLSLIEQRAVFLATDPVGSVSGLTLQPRGGEIDLGFLTHTYDYEQCAVDACSQHCMRVEARVAVDALNQDTDRLPSIPLAQDATQISTVIATYPAGATLIAGTRDMTVPEDSTTYPGQADPDPGAGAEPSDAQMIGDACAPFERVQLHSGRADGGLDLTTVEEREGSTTLASVEAFAAMGRLGVLLVDQRGGLEALVPAAGVVPETRLDLSFPDFTGRRWAPSAQVLARESGAGVYAAGVSEDRPEWIQLCESYGDNPPEGRQEQIVPECRPRARSIVVAGAGCGI